MKPWTFFLILALAAGGSAQGTLNGKFVLPTGDPVAGGTLLLQLSQAATSGGGNYLAPAQVSCYTSTDGSVVGVPNPQAAPAGSAFAGTGTLTAGTYFVSIAYKGPNGTTTIASPPGVFILSQAGELVINPPTLQPVTASGYTVFMGNSPAAETVQGSVTGWASYTQAAPLAAGNAMPTQNTTACTLLFNDQILPTGTWYTVTLQDAHGTTLAGFPRDWYLEGLSANVGALEPLATNPAVLFPMPLLTNPVNSNIPQSIRSGLDLNGFSISQSGNVGPGFFGTFWAGAAPAPGALLASWTPNTNIGIARIDINAQAAGAGGTHGLTITVSDGTTTCTFAGLLIATATASSEASSGAPNSCVFAAGVPVTVALAADDHTTEPQNLNLGFELLAH